MRTSITFGRVVLALAAVACGDGSDVVLGNNATGYAPCGGKKCGDQCFACPPNDPNCVETANVKYCDSSGGCQNQQTACIAASAH